MAPARQSTWRVCSGVFIAAAVFATPAAAGPPYLSDDPIPTEFRHFEIYTLAAGEHSREGDAGAAGIDFNYGATPDLQLTAVFPIEWERPHGVGLSGGIGNIEIAAKFRVLHQESFGWDVAIFPRVFLPSVSDSFGTQHASLLIPVWIGRDMGDWSTFGGGGCELNQGGEDQNFCLAGWALTRSVSERLRIGGEVFRQTADTRDDVASTSLGIGATYDLSQNQHLLGYLSRDVSSVERTSWYTSLLFTF
ncbi:MAG: transporter [Vitreimonas sp.]